MFTSVDDVIRRLAGQQYICDRSVATVVYLGCAMPRYMPYCDLVEECRNIEQLARVVDRVTT